MISDVLIPLNIECSTHVTSSTNLHAHCGTCVQLRHHFSWTAAFLLNITTCCHSLIRTETSRLKEWLYLLYLLVTYWSTSEWHSKIDYCTCNSPQMDSKLNQIEQFHLVTYFLLHKIFNIFFQFRPRSSKFSLSLNFLDQNASISHFRHLW
jgi:hypothetical protein